MRDMKDLKVKVELTNEEVQLVRKALNNHLGQLLDDDYSALKVMKLLNKVQLNTK